ncbi:MAG TPA: flagellar hook-basal body complex protein FliE [Candidatus Binatia bacterium]|nr:flagellar hook-basal body complex protein FliE [Candidatus Binatia bacterium]
MSDPVSSMSAVQSAIRPAAAGGPEAAGAANGPGFLDTLRNALDEVGQLQADADTKVSGLIRGNGEDVHTAMLAVEKADLTFQLMMQVRNKILAAYQEISQMQF